MLAPPSIADQSGSEHQGLELANVNQIIATISRALARLGLNAPISEVERWGFLVHEAMAGMAREFHTHEHVLLLARGADPIETLAALFHDVVYVQVDQGIIGPAAMDLRPFLQGGGSTWKITDAVERDATAALIARVFGRRAGDELTPFSGLNEFASALLAAKQFATVLSKAQLVEIAACIEATIPFRDGKVFDALYGRLLGLGLPELNELTAADAVRRAVRLGNRDVENFAEDDPARFLDNTWKLLPETNPALFVPSVYRISEFRMALQKMERFLSSLAVGRIFHAWGGEPASEVHEERILKAGRNLELALRYLRGKLYTMLLLEAIARATGGDTPVEFFMGGRPEPDEAPRLRLESFLPVPEVKQDAELDTLLLRLFLEGRASAVSFDIRQSPITGFLYQSLGEHELWERVERSRPFMRGEESVETFLERHKGPVTAAIARAACELAPTRKRALLELARRLEG